MSVLRDLAHLCNTKQLKVGNGVGGVIGGCWVGQNWLCYCTVGNLRDQYSSTHFKELQGKTFWFHTKNMTNFEETDTDIIQALIFHNIDMYKT